LLKSLFYSNKIYRLNINCIHLSMNFAVRTVFLLFQNHFATLQDKISIEEVYLSIARFLSFWFTIFGSLIVHVIALQFLQVPTKK